MLTRDARSVGGFALKPRRPRTLRGLLLATAFTIAAALTCYAITGAVLHWPLRTSREMSRREGMPYDVRSNRYLEDDDEDYERYTILLASRKADDRPVVDPLDVRLAIVDEAVRSVAVCPRQLLTNEGDRMYPSPRFHEVPPSPLRPRASVLPDATKLKIPRRIIQTNFKRRLPEKMHALITKLVDMNPTYEYVYFSDAEAESFTHKECGDRVWRAYLSLRPGAFRADLWRYCVLWKLGGVYLDTDFEALQPLDVVLQETDEWLTAEDNHLGWIFNAFVASAADHPLSRALLFEATRRTEERYLLGSVLSITGPDMAADVFRRLAGFDAVPFDNTRRRVGAAAAGPEAGRAADRRVVNGTTPLLNHPGGMADALGRGMSVAAQVK